MSVVVVVICCVVHPAITSVGCVYVDVDIGVGVVAGVIAGRVVVLCI